MSFLGEIKRRKVFQVAAVYAVVAWLLIQIVATVAPLINQPDWTATLVFVLLAIGFPITLIISWAFNLTPDGVVRDQGRNGTAQSGGRRIEYVLFGLLVVAVGWLAYREIGPNETPIEDVTATSTPMPESPEQEAKRDVLPNSVAILPFANLSPDPDNAYFAAGIHESTLNQLAKIRDISVIARTSVMQYEHNPPPIPKIAETLNVEMVMEGSVRYANDRVLITAQLIDGRTGTHIWSDEFDRGLTDIFGVQAEIAENIAIALQTELLPNERQRIQKVQTSSPQALALYLQASNLNYTVSGVGPNEDRHLYLDKAIELDPSFARAHAYKAYDYVYAMVRTRLPDDPQVSELEQLALEHARRALSLDPEENLAYVALANIHRLNWRAAEAETAYERALQLAPNDPYSLGNFSSFLNALAEHDQAISFGLRANQLDPYHSAHGRAYMGAGSFDAAYAVFDELQRIDPTNHYNYYMQAIAEWHRGNPESALTNIRISEQLAEDLPNQIGRNIEAYGLMGRHDDAIRLFHRLEQIAETYHISASEWARAYVAIGDYEQALTWMKQIDEERSPEDAISAFTLAINRNHNPVLERPEFIEVRNNLRLKR